jgi:hypothetical protein
MEEGETHSLDEYIQKFGGDFIETAAESYGVGFNGRALRILNNNSAKYPKYMHEHFLLNESKGTKCSEKITSLHHFHVDLNGDFIPPSCNGFRADIFDLCGKGLDDIKYVNFMSVATKGFKALFERAQDLGFIPDEGGYASKCAFCFDIKKHICGHIMSRTGEEPCDIGPAEFFEES